MSDGTHASPFAALFEWERKNRDGSGGGGGSAKVQVQGKQRSFKLRPGGAAVRRFHAGHRLAGTKINNIVKVKYVRPNRDATRHIIQHIDYIEKREREADEPERKFYGKEGERSRDDVIDSIMKNRGDKAAMFKIILSPKQNELNQIEYASEIMRRFEDRSGIRTDWSMVEHKNTQYHHVHIVMPGRDESGYSYRLEQDHLELMREIANQHQYEIQRLDYEYERQVRHEFGHTRDEANMILLSQKDRRDMKDLGVYRPELDEMVKEDLLQKDEFDPVHFSQHLQKEELAQTEVRTEHLASEGATLYAIATGKESVSEISHETRVEQSGEQEKNDEKTDKLIDEAKEAVLGAEKIVTGHEWSGLGAFSDPTAIEEPFDLSAEAQQLFASQQGILQELNEMNAPETVKVELKLEESLDNVSKDLDEIDKDDSDRSL